MLSRESQKRRSTKSVSSSSSVAPDFSSRKHQRSGTSARAGESSKRRHHSKSSSGSIPAQKPERNATGEELENGKGLSKQVSFKERLAEEIPRDDIENETMTSASRHRHRETRKSNRDKEQPMKGKQKDQRDRPNTRNSSTGKERNRSASRDRQDKSSKSNSSKLQRRESLEKEPQNTDRNDGSSSSRKSKRFKMPDLKNLLPGKKSDKQKQPPVTTIIGSDEDTDREGKGISCLSSSRHKHKYQITVQEQPSSTTDITSDESDFFRNSPNTVDLLTVCIDNQIPPHRDRGASQKSDRTSNLKRTSSLLSAADGEKSRSTRGQGHQKKDSPSCSSLSANHVSQNYCFPSESFLGALQKITID